MIRNAQAKFAAVLFALCGLAGCHKKEEKASEPPKPPVQQTSAPAPPTNPASNPAPPANPNPLTDTYLLKTDFMGPDATKTQFTVTINGATVGVFNAPAQQDVTDKLKSGPNVIDISWQGTPDSGSSANLTIGYNKAGQWNTIVTQSVAQGLPSGEKEYHISLGATDPNAPASNAPANAAPNTDSSAPPNTPASNTNKPVTDTPDTTVSPPNSPPKSSDAALLTEKYFVKTTYTGAAANSVEYTFFVNGEQVGAYSGSGYLDITDRLKPGKNEFKVTWKGKPDAVSVAKFTLGVERNGNTGALLTQEVTSKTLTGTKTLTLNAK